MEVIIENVSKSFRNGRKTLPVLEDIHLTLHNICAGLLSPDKGSVYFTGGRPYERTPGVYRIPGNRPHALAECV